MVVIAVIIIIIVIINSFDVSLATACGRGQDAHFTQDVPYLSVGHHLPGLVQRTEGHKRQILGGDKED